MTPPRSLLRGYSENRIIFLLVAQTTAHSTHIISIKDKVIGFTLRLSSLLWCTGSVTMYTEKAYTKAAENNK